LENETKKRKGGFFWTKKKKPSISSVREGVVKYSSSGSGRYLLLRGENTATYLFCLAAGFPFSLLGKSLNAKALPGWGKKILLSLLIRLGT